MNEYFIHPMADSSEWLRWAMMQGERGNKVLESAAVKMAVLVCAEESVPALVTLECAEPFRSDWL